MSNLFVGVELGGTNLRCAVIDEADGHKLVSRYETPTAAHEGCNAVVKRIGDGIIAAMKEAGVGPDDVRAAGVGVPGPIDQLRGIVHSTPNMPGWNMVPLADILQKATGLKTYVENDANCAGWGEYVAGAGRGVRHMMMVTLGTGIGGAIIIDGKLHIGRDGAAGELGHVCIIDGGLPCGCGARGCVEAYASATAVVRRFIHYLDDGWHSPLHEKRDFLTSYDIFTAAEAGDPVALRIVEETGHFLGVMASDVAELLNPERCVVSGGMIQAGENLFNAMRNTCMTRNQHPGRTMEIIPAALGGNAGLIGAADQAKVKLAAGDVI
ncbi:MAG: ROK family protein [Planctomycetaceae bacterium]|nr:ROK family protein [Planctomycetaceae bacterium]